PTAGIGDLLARSGPLRDRGAARLAQLGIPMQVVSVDNWCTGAIVVLLAAVLALSIRRQLREHRLTLSVMGVFALAASVLTLLLPGIRDSAWVRTIAPVGTSSRPSPCTHSHG